MKNKKKQWKKNKEVPSLKQMYVELQRQNNSTRNCFPILRANGNKEKTIPEKKNEQRRLPAASVHGGIHFWASIRQPDTTSRLSFSITRA